VRIQSFVVHPQYRPQDDGSLSSLHCNVGLAVLESPLPAHASLAPVEQLRKVRSGAEFVQVGYDISKAPRDFDPTAPPLIRQTSVVLVESDLMPGREDALPRLKVRIPPEQAAEGSPIFDNLGRVVGTLCAGSGDEHLIVPVDRLDDLEHR
jgi:hypothetical protein